MRRLARSRRGQSTVEYMVLLAAFVSMMGVLGLLWHAASDGLLLSLATAVASHSAEGDWLGALKDAAGF